MTTENKIPSNFISIPIQSLIKATWNYKTDDPEKAKVLKANIQRNGQIENLIVREVGDQFEVVNGNHRLDSMLELGMPEAICYNLGEIPDEQAYRVAVETNETRFDSDTNKLGELLAGLMDSFDVSELLETIPFSIDEIAHITDKDNQPPKNIEDCPNEIIEESFGIHIECRDEQEQQRLLDRFNMEGIKCRALIS